MAINKNYLQLDFKSGVFFKYSGNAGEGFEQHKNTKGDVSYRKYYKDGVTGALQNASIQDDKFGQLISLSIKDGDELYYTQVPLYDQKNNVSTYAESLIKLLPNLEKYMNVLVRGYNFLPEGDKYSKIGISITANGEKVKSALTNAYYKAGVLVAGDIPAIEWKEKLGKNKPTATSEEAKNDFLIGSLEASVERLKFEKQAETSAQAQPKKETSKTHAFKEEEHDDDLPF